jgi:hypothetical protein
MMHPSHPARVDGDVRDKDFPVPPAHGGGVTTGSVHRPHETHYDPAGKPVEFNSSSVCDQQAGGDLTCQEPETRDDNFIDNAVEAGSNRQLERDIGTGIDNFNEAKVAMPPKPVATKKQTESDPDN